MERLEPRRLFAFPELDLTFAEGGIADFTNPQAFSGEFFLVRELSNGKILLAGRSAKGVNEPIIARLNADGTPDTTFDGDGRLFIEQEGNSGINDAADVTVAPDGKILLLYHKAGDLKVYRFTADGAIDTTWGTNGVVTHRPGVLTAQGQTIDVQADGKIVISYLGFPAEFTSHELYISRLNADGSVDTSYRGGLANPQRAVFDKIEDSILQPDGKLVVVGPTLGDPDNPSFQDAVVARFNTDGTDDTTFSQDGRMDANPTAEYAIPKYVRLNADGNIVVNMIVSASQPPSVTSVVARITPAGVLDTTFGGGDGLASLDPAIGDNTAGPIFVDADGKITGVLNDSGQIRSTLFRLNENGTPDATFGTNGFASPGVWVTQEAFAIAETDDGDILVAGGNLAVGKFIPDSVDVHLSSKGTLFVNGTAAPDTIVLSQSGAQLILDRNGSDSTFTFGDVHKLEVRPSAGDDVITVPFSLDSFIQGGDGDDSITVGDGDMKIFGGQGLNGNEGGADGNDTVVAGDGDHQIELGDGNNWITVGAGVDSISTGEGDDTITMGPGSDTIFSGGGDDSIVGGNEDDTLWSGDGNDTVWGNGGDDIITGVFKGGGEGNKVYHGGAGDDIITGGNGRDTIYGAAGRDNINGQLNADYISGGGGNDKIAGGGGHDRLRGGAGQDRIDGNGGRDRIFGDDGNDIIRGGFAVDVIDGGAGNDFSETDFDDDVTNVETT